MTRKVSIIAGPLIGASGDLIDLYHDTERALVDIEILGRYVRTIISRDLIVLQKSLSDSALGFIKIPSFQATPIETDILSACRGNPEELKKLSPREFEIAVAQLLEKMGYSVQLTPETRDGGRDILAISKTLAGFEYLTIVECKRYRSTNKIGVDIVQRFLWTIDNNDRANCGLIATTSSFTRDAIKLQKDYKYKLNYADYSRLSDWLSQHGKWHKVENTGIWCNQY